MTTYRARGFSPPRPRRFEDSRASAGPVYSTAFDTRFTPQPRSAAEYSSSGWKGGERVYDAQPVSRKDYAATDYAGTQSKTEYAIRPRHSSLVRDDGRAPLRMLPPSSPNRTSPYINNFPPDRPRSPTGKRYYHPDDSGRYILPAKSIQRHHRRMSGSQIDPAYSVPARDSQDRTSYRVHGSRVYPASAAPSRYKDEDEDDYDFSYTTPREQFDRDYPPPQQRPRQDNHYRRDSPANQFDLDKWQTGSQAKRQSGPPPTLRQLDRLGDGEPRYSSGRSGNNSDNEQDSRQQRRPHSLKIPVSLHQEPSRRYSPSTADGSQRKSSRYQSRAYDEEPSYSSDRENNRSSGHHERHLHLSKAREDGGDRSRKALGVTSAGIGGLAVGGLAGALVKKTHGSDEDSISARGHKVKDRHEQERKLDPGDRPKERERPAEKPRDRAAEFRGEAAPPSRRREAERRERSESESIDDTPGDSRRSGRKYHRRRHESKPREHAPASASDEERAGLRKKLGRERAEREVQPENPESPVRDVRHQLDHRLASPEDEIYPEAAESIERDEDEGARAARLQLVEPAKEKEIDIRPKGILKPARQIPFPEDPNPTREGVAPLKDAGKKGIPPGARWTKINRMLVNPSALEAAHERYEERADYVIVLRVLSRDEIEKLSEQTKKIREARESEWREQRHRTRREGKVRGSNTSSEDDDSSADERRPQLAIEAAPQIASSSDPRNPDGYSANGLGGVPQPEPVPVGLGLRT